ncbi:MAG: DNA polymerase III subunit delta [bacterium]
MIIYIFGQDTFRSKQHLEKTVKQFKSKRDPQGYNIIFFDAKDEEVGAVFEHIKSAPFLSEKRMVIIRDILSSSDKDMMSQMIGLIKSKQSESDNVVVFWQGATLGKVKEVKDLEKVLLAQKYVFRFDLLTGAQLVDWICSQVKEQELEISPAAVEYLANNIGSDMWFLKTTISQLISYARAVCEPKTGVIIEIDHARLFLSEKVDDNMFNMVEAIITGNSKKAFKLLEKQRQLGEDNLKMIGLIAWQLRTMIMLRDLYERDDSMSSDQMAKKAGIHPFVAKKNLYLVKRYSMKKLKELYGRLAEVDYRSKSGYGSVDILFDVFIGKISLD